MQTQQEIPVSYSKIASNNDKKKGQKNQQQLCIEFPPKMTAGHLSPAQCPPPTASRRDHILLLRLIITIIHQHPPSRVQPTNFQHVQMCGLYNRAYDLATSDHRLDQSLWLSVLSLTALYPSLCVNADYFICRVGICSDLAG